MRFEGPKGTAYVFKGQEHDWVVEFWPKIYNRRHPRKTVRRTFSNSAKKAAMIVAKQMTGIYKEDNK